MPRLDSHQKAVLTALRTAGSAMTDAEILSTTGNYFHSMMLDLADHGLIEDMMPQGEKGFRWKITQRGIRAVQ